MTVIIFDCDGDEVIRLNDTDFIPCINDRVRLENGDYYIVNDRTWYVDTNCVVLVCAYYGNID